MLEIRKLRQYLSWLNFDLSLEFRWHYMLMAIIHCT